MTDKPSRGRQRLYATNSEKTNAFRERNKEMGLLRKEVLVSAETAARLSELAKQQETSVTNVASGLLEMGLSHYEALHSLGYVVSSAELPVEPLASSFSASATPVGSPVDAQTMAAISGALASAVRSQTASLAESQPPVEGAARPQGDAPPIQLADPITQFFQKRKATK